jgi:hypothetical protein
MDERAGPGALLLEEGREATATVEAEALEQDTVGRTGLIHKPVLRQTYII